MTEDEWAQVWQEIRDKYYVPIKRDRPRDDPPPIPDPADPASGQRQTPPPSQTAPQKPEPKPAVHPSQH